MWSLEVNHKRALWDVFACYCGFRYFNMEERYSLYSEQPDTDNARLLMATDSDMYGGQFGMDMFYPLGRYCSVGGRSRFGLYLTDNEVANGLINDGNVVFKNCDTDIDIAGQAELGAFLNVQLTECCAIRAGYELWYFDSVTTIRGQFRGPIGQGFGVPARTDDNLVYYGGTLGVFFTF
jgi:hypothetical protein